MQSQDSANDFFVCGFQDGTVTMDLVETGKGGMARVAEILAEKFEDKVAVAMFRVTAVDDRGVTTSYRTKLLHVVYCGPKMKTLAKAKVASYNAALRNPFTSNMQIQIDSVDALSEADIERSLRAAGGAHQPTSFDFKNESVPSAS